MLRRENVVYVTTVCDSRKEPVWLRPGFGKLTGKGQIVNIFGFVRHAVCREGSALLSSRESSYRPQHNVGTWLYSNKTLHVNTEIWISYRLLGSWCITVLSILFKPCESVKAILSLRTVQNQAVGGACLQAVLCRALACWALAENDDRQDELGCVKQSGSAWTSHRGTCPHA